MQYSTKEEKNIGRNGDEMVARRDDQRLKETEERAN